MGVLIRLGIREWWAVARRTPKKLADEGQWRSPGVTLSAGAVSGMSRSAVSRAPRCAASCNPVVAVTCAPSGAVLSRAATIMTGEKREMEFRALGAGGDGMGEAEDRPGLSTVPGFQYHTRPSWPCRVCHGLRSYRSAESGVEL